VAVLGLGLGACSSSSHSSTSPTTVTTTGSSASTSTPTTAGAPAARPINHVFVINLENKDYASTWGPGSVARYLNGTLVPQGVLLTKYYAIGHVSLDNYIAEISGQSPNPSTQSDCIKYTEFVAHGTGAHQQALGQGCVYPSSVSTVANQLTAAHLTWHSYQESMGVPCRHPQIGTIDTTIAGVNHNRYVTRHNPFVYFHSIIDGGACVANVVDLSSLLVDLTSAATTPNLSFITPNLCNDAHDCSLAQADAFLQLWVPRILASPAYKAGGMLVITLDESDNDASACCNTPPSPNTPKPGGTGPGGGLIGALVLSPHAKVGATSAVPYNHYALLCSIENAFGLAHLGFAGAPGLTCFGNDIYR